MNNKIFATLSLSLEEVDVVLNALEEKALNVQSLRQNIYDTVKAQIPTKEVKHQVINIKKKKGNKKKDGRQKNSV